MVSNCEKMVFFISHLGNANHDIATRMTKIEKTDNVKYLQELSETLICECWVFKSVQALWKRAEFVHMMQYSNSIRHIPGRIAFIYLLKDLYKNFHSNTMRSCLKLYKCIFMKWKIIKLYDNECITAMLSNMGESQKHNTE